MPTSFDSPASEPTEDEIAEALRTMGEKCECPSVWGTALFHHGTMTVDCPIHGERTHQSALGLDTSVWQTPMQPGDTITFEMTATIGSASAKNTDINIMKGTALYGQELESKGQEIQEIEVRDASPGPRYIYSTEGDE